jgi:dihydrofolate reductase
MRRLIFQEYMTLDGYAAGLDGGLEFFSSIPEHPDDNLELLEGIDTMLLGAQTYREWADLWPTERMADHPIAVKLNALRLVVVSTKLQNAPWGSYEPGLVIHDLDAVRALKAEDTGKDIILWGSITLFQSLLRAGLVDEIQLRICPLLLGAGRSAFPAGQSPVAMDLLEARPWGAGGVLLRYRPS